MPVSPVHPAPARRRRTCGRAAAALWLALLAALPATAAMLGRPVPGAWPGGRVVWTYNPAGRPAGIGDAEVIALVAEAFAGWQRACNVEGVYGGLTSVPPEPAPTSTFVVGWVDFGSAQFGARAGPAATTLTNGHARYSGGRLSINAHPDRVAGLRSALDNGQFLGTLQHEVGHVLGLAHSDEPSSIMFANPYNTLLHNMQLQGDDVTACADLYGAKGLLALPDRRQDKPAAAPFPLHPSILEGLPGPEWPQTSLDVIDPAGGATYAFSTHWREMPPGTRTQRQWVSPLGSPYQRTPVTVDPYTNGYRYNTSTSYRLPFAGQWSYQVLVDDQLVVNLPFQVLRASVSAGQPFEVAWVGERDAAGMLAWRQVGYGIGRPLRSVLVHQGAVLPNLSMRPQPGVNQVELWVQTDRPRYKPDQDDGQPTNALDVARRLSFQAAADGALLASPPISVESGTSSSYSASASVVIADPVSQGVYVAASLGGTLYFRTPAGWSTTAAPLLAVRGPAVVVLDLVRHVDLRTLPPGTRLYVGHGSTLDEVVAKGQYRLVRSF